MTRIREEEEVAFDLLTQKVHRFMPLPSGPVVPVGIKMFIRLRNNVHSFTMEKQTGWEYSASIYHDGAIKITSSGNIQWRPWWPLVSRDNLCLNKSKVNKVNVYLYSPSSRNAWCTTSSHTSALIFASQFSHQTSANSARPQIRDGVSRDVPVCSHSFHRVLIPA